nr:phospholipase-like protein [Tanacetum cinerariifolium]
MEMVNPPEIFDAKVSLRLKMHLMSTIKESSRKKDATYNLNGFVWALKIWILETYPNCIQRWTKQPDIIPRALAWSNFRKFDKTEYQLLFGPDSVPILELTPTDKELKETWLIGSLSYIRGEDVPFIQSVKPVENVDQAVAIDDHILTCPTDSNTLLEDVDSLFKEVIDVRPDLFGRVGELRTKIVQTLASTVSNKETVVGNQWFDDALQDNAEEDLDETLKDNAEIVDTMDNEDGKFCLDDMSIGFEEDHLNGVIKVTLYQDDHIPLDETMDVAVKDTPVVTNISLVVETIVIDSTFKNKKVNLDQCITDVMDAENNTVGLDTPLLKHGFGLVERKRTPSPAL